MAAPSAQMVSRAFAESPAVRIWPRTCCVKLLAIRVDCLFGRKGVATSLLVHVPDHTPTAAVRLVVSLSQMREATGT
jgi:hypothetical protein